MNKDEDEEMLMALIHSMSISKQWRDIRYEIGYVIFDICHFNIGLNLLAYL